MKYKITPAIAILISILFFSCKKDKQEESADFPQDLHFTNMVETRGLRVFTNKTEITDNEVKARFIKGSSTFNTTPRPGYEWMITFQSKDVLNIDALKFAVTKNDDLFLFYADQQQSGKNNDPVYDMLKYSYAKTPVINVSGADFLTKEVLAGHGDYKELNLAMFQYRLKRGDGVKTVLSINEGGIFNEFNEQFITKLGVNDTLAIHEYVYNMKAK